MTPQANISPARACAYAVLRRVFEQGAYADQALHAEARDLDSRARALAMRLAYGAVQRRRTLDHLIERLSDRPPTRLDPPLLGALRLGLHELLYMRGAPDYAAVAQAVELAKLHARAGHGLVNAVLRRALREGPAELLAALADDTPEHAAIRHSHPDWLARLWWAELGPEHARALMAFDNEPSEVALRANTLVRDAGELAAALPVATHRDALVPEALVLEAPFDVRASELWLDGSMIAQSRAAMLVSRMLAPAAGERVLDLCAAPGGKSTHLAALMQGEGEIVSVERDRARAAALSRTATRMHAANIRVELGDAESWAAQRGASQSFDRVLVDPPCSGLGTLQARPDLRWRVTPASLAEMAANSLRILSCAARALRPEGVLVYSTCTISASENQRVIEAFLDAHSDFSLDDLGVELPALALQDDNGGAPTRKGTPLLTLPHRDRTAGFFIARVRRGS